MALLLAAAAADFVDGAVIDYIQHCWQNHPLDEDCHLCAYVLLVQRPIPVSELPSVHCQQRVTSLDQIKKHSSYDIMEL
jgi:hypothetical protein